MGKSDQDIEKGLKFTQVVQGVISAAFEEVKPTSNRIDEIINNPEAISEFFKNLFAAGTEKNPESILRLISDGANLKIGACTGKRTIANAKKVFKSYIGPNFKNLGLNEPGICTGEKPIDVYEMTNDATFKQMFTSRSTDLNKMVLTQHQIIKFCERHSDWLHQDGGATFFLIKRADGEYFVVIVLLHSGSLYTNVVCLEHDNVWDVPRRRRVVFPQLSTLLA